MLKSGWSKLTTGLNKFHVVVTMKNSALIFSAVMLHYMQEVQDTATLTIFLKQIIALFMIQSICRVSENEAKVALSVMGHLKHFLNSDRKVYSNPDRGAGWLYAMSVKN